MAVSFPGVEVIRTPENHAVLTHTKKKKHKHTNEAFGHGFLWGRMLGVTSEQEKERDFFVRIRVGFDAAVVLGGWRGSIEPTVVLQGHRNESKQSSLLSQKRMVDASISSPVTSRGASFTPPVAQHVSALFSNKTRVYYDIVHTKVGSHAGLNRTWETQAMRYRIDGAWHMQWISAAGFSPSCSSKEKNSGKLPILTSHGWVRECVTQSPAVGR